jgi:hypothetical protein
MNEIIELMRRKISIVSIAQARMVIIELIPLIGRAFSKNSLVY